MKQLALSPLGFDALWSTLDLGDFPLVLQLRSHGQTLAERAALIEHELPRLHVDGAMRNGAILPDVARALAILADPEREFDVRAQGRTGPWRAVAVSGGSQAVVVVRNGVQLTLDVVHADQLAAATASTLGDYPAGTPAQVSTSADQLDAVYARIPDGPSAVAAALVRCGATHTDALTLAGAFTGPEAKAVIGGAVRVDGRRRRVRRTVVVIDTAVGRYLCTESTAGDGTRYSTVRSANPVAVTRAINELIAPRPGA